MGRKQHPVVIYEDQDLIIIDKPAGLLSVPDRFDADRPNARRWLLARYSDAIPIHRLDMETSGVLAFAKNQDAHRHYGKAFEERSVSKKYYAIVLGSLSSQTGEIDQPILKHDFQNLVSISKKGRPAITRYRVEESFGAFSVLELDLITGRTHQIRAHLQFIGHPLLVDPKYGGRESFMLSEIKPSYRGRMDERPLLTRTPLHAHQLTLTTPNREVHTIESPLPKDMKAVIYQLRKCL